MEEWQDINHLLEFQSFLYEQNSTYIDYFGIITNTSIRDYFSRPV